MDGKRLALGKMIQKRRGRFEIMADILFVARYGATLTEIVYNANLNFTSVKSYIDYLEEKGLLENSGSFYKLTERGKEFLRKYQMVKATLATEEPDNLNLIFENMLDGVYIVSKDYKVEFMNQVLIDEFGNQVGTICYEVFHDRKEPCPRCKNIEVMNGKTVRWEWHSRRKNKTYDLIETPLENLDGTLSKLTIFRDITDYKQAEESLRKAKEFSDSLIASMRDGFSILDSRGVHLDVNGAFCQMTGFSREELIGVGPPHPYWPPEAYEEIERAFQKTLRGEFGNFELTFMRKNGDRFPVIVSPSWIKDKQGNVISYFATVKDITERVRADAESKKHMKELERVNRELGDFTSTVSHDLKVPLRSLHAFSILLLEDYADKLDETGRGYLNRVKEASERMDALIQDLLTLSRVGRKFIELEEVDLNELLEEIKTDLSAQIEKRGGKVVSGNLPSVSTQRVWMKELLTNLIENGLKFNKSDTPRVEVNYEEREEDYLFNVKDNGIGIEEKSQANIFNLFERVHTPYEYEGTGAGLAICKKIVKELGGAIWVESKFGEGSTFYFTIPRN